MLIFAEPSNDAVPVTSPVRAMSRAVASLVAVAALPVMDAAMVSGRLIVYVLVSAANDTVTSFSVP